MKLRQILILILMLVVLIGSNITTGQDGFDVGDYTYPLDKILLKFDYMNLCGSPLIPFNSEGYWKIYNESEDGKLEEYGMLEINIKAYKREVIPDFLRDKDKSIVDEYLESYKQSLLYKFIRQGYDKDEVKYAVDVYISRLRKKTDIDDVQIKRAKEDFEDGARFVDYQIDYYLCETSLYTSDGKTLLTPIVINLFNYRYVKLNAQFDIRSYDGKYNIKGKFNPEFKKLLYFKLNVKDTSSNKSSKIKWSVEKVKTRQDYRDYDKTETSDKDNPFALIESNKGIESIYGVWNFSFYKEKNDKSKSKIYTIENDDSTIILSGDRLVIEVSYDGKEIKLLNFEFVLSNGSLLVPQYLQSIHLTFDDNGLLIMEEVIFVRKENNIQKEKYIIKAAIDLNKNEIKGFWKLYNKDNEEWKEWISTINK